MCGVQGRNELGQRGRWVRKGVAAACPACSWVFEAAPLHQTIAFTRLLDVAEPETCL